MGYFDSIASGEGAKAEKLTQQAGVKAALKEIQRKLFRYKLGQKPSEEERRKLIDQGHELLIPCITKELVSSDQAFVLYCAACLLAFEQEDPELETCNRVAEVLEAAFGGISPEHLNAEFEDRTLYQRFAELEAALKTKVTGQKVKVPWQAVIVDASAEGSPVIDTEVDNANVVAVDFRSNATQ